MLGFSRNFRINLRKIFIIKLYSVIKLMLTEETLPLYFLMKGDIKKKKLNFFKIFEIL